MYLRFVQFPSRPISFIMLSQNFDTNTQFDGKTESEADPKLARNWIFGRTHSLNRSSRTFFYDSSAVLLVFV